MCEPDELPSAARNSVRAISAKPGEKTLAANH
jgi:hypothetical protein